MRVLNNELRHIGAVLCVLCVVVIATACNDKPTDIALDLTPGTDTLFTESSADSGITLTATATSQRLPILNSTYTLLGKTTDSEARMIVEFINYPTIGAASDYDVIASDLQLVPTIYRYGDTNNRVVGIAAYELKRMWPLNATWDSIWDSDGSTTYYSTADPAVSTYSQSVTVVDTTIDIPFSIEATKRWIDIGADSNTSNQLFGIVLLPTETGAITLFRNLNGTDQLMRLRVIYKHKDSTSNDTTFIGSAVINFVDTPPPATDELLTQGARIHNTTFDVDLSSMPRNAMILGAKLSVTADVANSTFGTPGIDEILGLSYTPSDGSGTVEYLARFDATTSHYVFNDITYVLQKMVRDTGKGTLVLAPTDKYQLWQMNRIRIHNMQADSTLRPRISVIYTVPALLP